MARRKQALGAMPRRPAPRVEEAVRLRRAAEALEWGPRPVHIRGPEVSALRAARVAERRSGKTDTPAHREATARYVAARCAVGLVIGDRAAMLLTIVYTAERAAAARGSDTRAVLDGDVQRAWHTIRAEWQRAAGADAALQALRKKGGAAEKKLQNVWTATCLLVGAEPTIKARRAWDRLPQGGYLSPNRRVDWLIYRDGDRLVDDRAGEGRSISFSAFRDYMTDARKLLRAK